MFAVFAMVQSQGQCDKDKMQNANKPMPTPTKQMTKFDRLPDGVDLSDEVKNDIKNNKGEVVSSKIITVEEKLKELGAKYEKDRLVDAGGREIRFYTPPLRGASQGFEEDEKQRKRDARELAELQKKYTVIILYVNPLKAV
jgi:ABC-type phosphate transport system auxiliary subunit